MRPDYAISIRQPFVEQILRGLKKREYRSIRTNIRGTVYLYASLKPVEDPWGWRHVCDLPMGAIVGTVDVVGCVDDGDGGFAYLLENPVRFEHTLRAVNQPQPVFWRPKFR
jgi:hypothetical protein